MKSKRQVKDVVAAENKSIGFDFQYYYFLCQLIKLKQNEQVGLEVKDDVHIDFPDGTQALIQLKHTVQKKVDGNPINLTTNDIDLWKTISNWCKMICDKNEGRSDVKDQELYINRSNFILVSNKSANDNNIFLKSMGQYHKKAITFTDLLTIINDIKNTSDNETLKLHIDDFFTLKQDIQQAFLNKTIFHLNEDDVISQCKLAIKDCKIPEKRIDDVFKSLDSQIREDNYYNIKSGYKISISGNEFYRKYRKHFDKGFNNNSLIVRNYNIIMPDKIENQLFIRQLCDIQDIPDDDIESMVEFTRYKLHLQNNIEQWIQDGELTQSEVNDYRKAAILQWKNEFRAKYRNKPLGVECDKKAQEIVDSMRSKSLILAGETISLELSNGEYYYLSDQPAIGWRHDWKERYSNGNQSI